MLTVSASVQSESNGAPIPAAQVLVTDPSGNWQVATRADQDGNFSIMLPDTSPNIMVVAPGYAARILDGGEVADQRKVELKEASLAENLTSIEPNTTLSKIPAWVWIAGAGGLVYAIMQDGKKSARLSGEGSQDYSKYILPVGILVGGYLVLNKVFGFFGKDTGTGQNNTTVTNTIAQGTAKSLADLASKGIQPTLSAANAASIANNIFYTGLQVTANNTSGIAAIFNLLNQAENDADIYLIMQNFGARKVSSSDWSLCSLANVNCDAVDLDTFVTAILTNFNVPGLTIRDLNDQLHDIGYGFQRGITFNF